MSIPFSLELYPPTSPQSARQLERALPRLAALGPEYFSVTYGAGGCTRERTLDLVGQLHEAGHTVAPHLSGVGAERAEVAELCAHYRRLGVRRLFALRGDTPSGMGSRGDFAYASDLVRFIREHSGDDFRIEVAAYPEVHPQAKSPAADLAALRVKQEAGANAAVTQYFFNTDAFLYLRDSCHAAGITLPLVPGVLPLTRFRSTAQRAEARGIEMPRWIYRKMESLADDTAAVRAFGLDVTARQCERLIAEGVPALHFFSLNQIDAIEALHARLGLAGSAGTTAAPPN
ncbi:methylenetetrahydrofolate reductase [Pseudogulbenkiania ferrooxidans]|uniref:Methylenetetrahydrofolate reductase n=1 Tax=Pseudogulbenkiania ferrooxidans 2002 TaxID=279714 RepID=B9Z0I7_9NEIS|nr:methylenetetrahydrofolate reductase [Pseudogulbenkiania ferrooxidans]EEG09593.1 Methylenetetrahydrofolate reductase (NAD(P)H) [Pseudogulbenkiania ferrooxidans 2002]